MERKLVFLLFNLRWAQLYVSLVFCEFGFQACYYRPSFTGSVFTSWAMLKIYGYGYGQNLGILIIWWFWPYQPWTFGNLIIFNSFHRGHLHSKRQNNWTDNSSRSILSWSSCKHNHLVIIRLSGVCHKIHPHFAHFFVNAVFRLLPICVYFTFCLFCFSSFLSCLELFRLWIFNLFTRKSLISLPRPCLSTNEYWAMKSRFCKWTSFMFLL